MWRGETVGGLCDHAGVFYCQRCRMQVGDIRSHDELMHSEPMDVRTARRIVAEYECATSGHSWDVVETLAHPTHIICGRCGESYQVEAKDAAKVS